MPSELNYAMEAPGKLRNDSMHRSYPQTTEAL